MVTIRMGLFPGLVLLALIFVAKMGYDYYRVFAWRQTTATVISTRQTCEYAKKSGIRSLHREYPFCDDSEEITRLTTDGYKSWDNKRLQIEAVYEVEPGKKTIVTFDASLEDAEGIKPGSTIDIRASAGNAELATMPNPTLALLLLALSGVGYAALRSRRKGLL